MLKKIILSVLIISSFLLSATLVYASQNNSTVKTSPTKIEYDQKVSNDTTMHVTETEDANEIKENSKFEIKKAKITTKGLIEDNTKLTTATYTAVNKKPFTINTVTTLYSDPNDSQRFIFVSQSKDTGKSQSLEDRLAQNEKVSINNVDVWIVSNSHNKDILQIMFWTNGKYYNVTGSKISKDELLQQAGSLIQ